MAKTQGNRPAAVEDLGWDPVTQSVRDTLLPRTTWTFVDDQRCLSGPVREHWSTSSGAAIDYRKAASSSSSSSSSTAGGSCDFQESVGSTLHFEGAEQFESYFSTLMADDFFNPVEESLVPQ
jgi:hypothetical protein